MSTFQNQDDAKLQEIADKILLAQVNGSRLNGQDLDREIKSAEDAYAVQTLVADCADSSPLGPVAGYKIGLSSKVDQNKFGLSEPVYGRAFQARIFENNVEIEARRDQSIGVECEVAVTLAADMNQSTVPYSASSAADSVLSVHTAIEIIENRFDDLASAGVWAWAADNLLGRGGIIAAGSTAADRGVVRNGTMSIDGAVCKTGSSSELHMGGPMGCLAWLANQLSQTTSYLRAGQVVFCGGITTPYWLDPAQGQRQTQISANVDGLGTADCRINWT